MAGYTDSLTQEATLTLLGVWMHDPLSPEATAEQYLYGKASRSSDIDVPAGAMQYAGRTFPIFEFGEQESNAYRVTIHVPNGPDWAGNLDTLQAFSRARRTLCFRDNRRRRMFGRLSGYQETDEVWGTAVTLQFLRADYDESVA